MGEYTIFTILSCFFMLLLLFGLVDLSLRSRNYGKGVYNLVEHLAALVILLPIYFLGLQLEALHSQASRALFMSTKVVPVFCFIIFISTLYAFIISALGREKYEELGDYNIPGS